MPDLLTLSFARPLWLWGLIPAAALLILLYRLGWQRSAWEQILPKHFQPWLLSQQAGDRHRLRFITLGLSWLLAIVALAGPSIEGPATPRMSDRTVVIVLDVSSHMLADDLTPDRLTRAKQKIRTLIQQQTGTQFGLIAFAGSAHRVMPPSRDRTTMASLLAALEPDIMPIDGQDLDQALQLASEMISTLPRSNSQVLLVTSGLDESQQPTLAQHARELGPQLAVLGVGTAAGAPVPLAGGGFLRDEQGRILLPRLQAQQLSAIVRQHAGRYHTVTIGERDLNHLLRPAQDGASSAIHGGRMLSDQGHWLMLLLLPIAALGARRGWLGLLLCAALLPEPAAALEWADFWQRPDQQAQQLLQEQQPAAAAERFQDPLWRAWALYQSGQYQESAELWEALSEQHPEQAEYHFNRATAYAMAGDYQQALEAYEQTLTRAPDYHAARHNRDRIEALLAAQEKEPPKEPQEDTSETQHESPPTTKTPPSDNQSVDQPTGAEPALAEESTDITGQSGSPDNSQAASLNSELDEPVSAVEGNNPNSMAMPSSAETAEQKAALERQQSLEQWLRSIPDDPAELLRRKFLYQHLQQKDSP